MFNDFIDAYLYQQVHNLKAKSTYQVLIGKRTPTSLYYSWSNDLDPFFNSLANFSEADYQKWLNVSKSVNISNREQALILKIGLQGLGYLPPAHQKRRQLALQLYFETLSHLAYGQKAFSPIVTDIPVQNWLRAYLRMQEAKGALKLQEDTPVAKASNEAFLQTVYSEWQTYLSTLPEVMADVLMGSFAGYHLPPRIAKQSQKELNLNTLSMTWFLKGLYNHCYNYFLSINTLSPTRDLLIGIVKMTPPWNLTADKTLKYYQAGFRLDEIAKRRHLKTSTISDHYVDIFLREPEVFQTEVEKSLGMSVETLAKTRPPEEFFVFREEFPKSIFWQYRYWQMLYHKESRSVE